MAVSLVAFVPAGAVQAATAAQPPGASSCSGCHPPNARIGSPVPQLVGQNAAAIVAAMTAFRSGDRPATVMDRIAKGFTEAETKAIADWYASQK